MSTGIQGIRRARRRFTLALGLALLGVAAPSRAADPGKGREVSARAADREDALARSRKRFSEGAALVQEAQWAEALAAFEESAALHPHPVTTYNIGACERALGRYTRARRALTAALGQKDDRGAPLAVPFADQARVFLAEIERVLVRAEVTVSPVDVALAVDGRPLASENANPVVLAAGTDTAAAGGTVPAHFTLLVDPGHHLFTLSRKGYSDVIVNRTLAPATRPQLGFELNRLPAHLRIDSNRPGAAVSLDGVDVGTAPLSLERPAGAYRLSVREKGFAPYESRFTVAPGEELNLTAPLAPEKRSIVTRWWFWTAIGVVVAGAAVGTYFAAAGPPPIDGGGLGWAVKVP